MRNNKQYMVVLTLLGLLCSCDSAKNRVLNHYEVNKIGIESAIKFVKNLDSVFYCTKYPSGRYSIMVFGGEIICNDRNEFNRYFFEIECQTKAFEKLGFDNNFESFSIISDHNIIILKYFDLDYKYMSFIVNDGPINKADLSDSSIKINDSLYAQPKVNRH